MNLNLKGKIALITGSTNGLGKTIAVALAEEGVDVIINGRSNKKVDDTAKEIRRKFNNRVHVYQCTCDVTDSNKIKKFFHEQMPQIGRLDILINNVGHVEKFGSFIDITDKDWMQCYNLVCMSAVRFTREAIPFLAASHHGRIINISSLSSHQPGNFNHHYAAAKAAMNTLTKQLATSLGNMNILVNAICPSTIDSESWRQNIKYRAKINKISIKKARDAMEHEESKKSPLSRMGKLENVADMVVYLSSDKANFQTGHIYNIDGGATKGL